MDRQSGLSDNSKEILSLIRDGYGYDQILLKHPDFSYLDIFNAAKEDLQIQDELVEVTKSNKEKYQTRIRSLRERYPNAYRSWKPEDDEELVRLYSAGTSVTEIASRFERQPSAIRCRLFHLYRKDNWPAPAKQPLRQTPEQGKAISSSIPQKQNDRGRCWAMAKTL